MTAPYASLETALGEALLRTTSDAILLIDDTSWRVVGINESAGRLFEAGSDRLVGAALETLFTLDGESAVERMVWRARTEPDGLELMVDAAGGARRVRMRAQRCEFSEGSICVLSLRDLSGLDAVSRELEQTRLEQQRLWDVLDVGLLVLDSNGRVLQHNRFEPIEELFGPSIRGRNFFLDIVRSGDTRPVLQRFHEWAHGFERAPYREAFEFEIGRRRVEADLRVGVGFADGAAVVRLIDKTDQIRSEEQLRHHAFQAEEEAKYAAIVAEMAGLLFESLEPDRVLETAASEVCRILGASVCQVLEVQGGASVRLLCEFARPGVERVQPSDAALEASPIVAEATRTLRPIGIESVAGHPLADERGLLASLGARAAAAAPMTHERAVRGILLVCQTDRARQWTESELNLLGSLADQLGLSLKNAQAFERLREDHARGEQVIDLVRTLNGAADLEAMLDASATFFASTLSPALYAIWHPATAVAGSLPVRAWARQPDGGYGRETQLDALVERLEPLVSVARAGGVTQAEIDGVPALVAPIVTSNGETGVLLLTARPESEPWQERDRRLVADGARALGAEIGSAALLGVVLVAKQMWEKTFDAMSDGIVVHDPALKIVRVNRAFARLLRTGPARLVGVWLPGLLDGANQEIVERACERVAATRRAFTFDVDDPALGGTVSISISLLRTADGNYFIQTIRDITDQRVMQERLAQASKMASIGRLATGVAHEINTPLATITGCAQSLVRQLANLSELTSHAKWPAINDRLTTIVEQSFRCKKITRDLLDFAKPTKPSLTQCSLERVAAEAIETVERERESGRITLRPSGGGEVITTDPDLVRQILINLIINALDATEESGKVVVETRFLKRLAKLAVRDRGTGIPPNEIERIFDPFYTTKPPGKGTGLGLSISQSLASSLGARIEVSSEVGRGSQFTLVLQRDPHGRGSS